MKRVFKLFLTFYISLFSLSGSIKLCLAYTLTGSLLLDLQETTVGTFGTGWTASALKTPGVRTYSCNGKLLMGGYNILANDANEFFQVTYSSLPAHNLIYFSLLFWEIDSWDPGESDTFQLKFDNTILNGWVLPQQSTSKNLCGGMFGELIIKLIGTVVHSASSLNFKVISQLSQLTSDESFGFREISMTFALTTGITLTDKMCAITPISMPSTVTTCTCLPNQYEYPLNSGNCYACHSDCATCTSSASTSCLSCVQGKYLSGTQCVTCHPSCFSCSGVGSTSCISCQAGYFLTSNGECVTPCNLPLTVSSFAGVNYCNSPCGSLSSFIYWDQSCSSTCPAIYKQEIIGSYKLCEYPCGANEYLYWNGSCILTCDPPLTITVQHQKNLCTYPCTSDEYLYWNGSCKSSCPSPLLTITDSDGLRYCNNPCSTSQYFSWDGFCIDSCSLPFRIQQSNCSLPCDYSIDYYNVDNRTCSEQCNPPNLIDRSGPFLMCLPPGPGNTLERVFLFAPLEPETPTLVVLVRIMQYVRYLDIEMPIRLQRLALSKGRSILSLNYGFHMPEAMQAYFKKNPLDNIFEKHDLHSQFLVNFWQEITSLAIIAIGMIIFIVLETLSKRREWKLSQAIFATLSTITQWNLCIILLSSSIDNIILYSYLEFTTFYNSLDSALTYISLLICIIMIFSIFGLVGFVIFLIHKRAPISRGREISSEEKCIAFSLKYKPFRVVYLGFNNDKIIGRFFFLVYMTRIGLPMIFATILHDYPVLQSFLQIIITLSMIGLLLFVKPIRDTITHFQLLIFEVIVLIMNVCVTTITVHDLYDVQAVNEIIVFGDLIVIGNACLNIITLIFLTIKICRGIAAIYPLLKTKSLEEKVAYCVQLLSIPIQLGGMGFETIFGTYSGINLTMELGAENDVMSARKKTLDSSYATVFGQFPQVTNKISPEQLNNSRSEEMSELKHRLDHTPNLNSTQERNILFTETTNPSRHGTPFKGNNYETESLNQSQVAFIGNRNSSVRRRDSGELPSSSVMDSSFIPINRENRIANICNNNLASTSQPTSYDIGDSLFIETNSPIRGIDVSASNHITPISFNTRGHIKDLGILGGLNKNNLD